MDRSDPRRIHDRVVTGPSYLPGTSSSPGPSYPSGPSYPPGARIEVRDAEWIVRTCVPVADGHKITAVGASEFVQDEEAVFFTGLEKVSLLRPEETVLEQDATPRFAKSRLFIEAVLRRTPLPQTERGLALSDSFLLDPLVYQQRPAELALRGVRPRLLIADVVGLGKTLEIGLILAELIRRGRGERILVVTPQQVLEQFQRELWTRFAIPLIRLDSLGIERIQRELPAGRNPFTHYKRIIVSVDTLKNEGRYGQHLEHMQWDAVVIDESHNLIGESTLRNRLAKLLARRTDALLLASATPHNGKARSFAELIRMLDPTAIVDEERYEAKQIDHLYIRRTKVSPEVRDQMGARWPDRGPSVPITCQATPAEEKVFEELTRVWLAGDERPGGPVVDSRNRLFPYTLLKAFLSSHRALRSTVENRLRNAREDREIQALTTLKELADQITDKDSSKLAALVTELEKIGVRDGNRVVVFSESVETVNWLADVLPDRLKLPTGAVDTMLGSGMTDQQQLAIIERFGLSGSDVRLLITTDVTSEGVNLHRQCHHLIHYDVPWSLIRIEQRNGRIDRYGQNHQPRFSALLLTSRVDGAKDDRTVSAKLLEKEETAHRAFGTAEAITGEYRPEAEERRLIQDLLAGKTVEESVPDVPIGDLLGPVEGQVSEGAPARADVPRLFAGTREFVGEAVDTLNLLPGLEDDGALLAFVPPRDLVHRLSALPADYLRTHDVKKRMKVTFDMDLARRKLAEARDQKTLWPDTAYLSDLHPLVDWVTDKVLVQLGRQTAPVIVARVDEPTYLVQGAYSNHFGRPTVVEWMAVASGRVLPGKMPGILTAAGVGPDMTNTGRPIDLGPLTARIPDAVATARRHLEERRAHFDAEIVAPLAEYRDHLESWRQLALDGTPASHQKRAEARVDDTVERQRRLLDSLQTTGEPLLRVLAVVVPEATR
ncbi:DEAD/DEAH box helicase [Actinomadura sp. 3N508]|uniref:DEAD/DEAH box helicase n=1 Tax=Actinomadura sp. 3N508 TaxID=3375153 RepID=UPI00379927EE